MTAADRPQVIEPPCDRDGFLIELEQVAVAARFPAFVRAGLDHGGQWTPVVRRSRREFGPCTAPRAT
ncbi:hypothetical protein ACFV2N_36050 [Streptomyces sp. NPDC059680]|uniref:hypothetical protein n=1 Tax=Streptomyces sp. NPDC059680 TaxID=3346904 RepID=UPI003693DC7A